MGQSSKTGAAVAALAGLLIGGPIVYAQERESVAVEAVEELEAAETKEQLQDEVNQANNPLADLIAVNLHNYFVPRINGVPDESANTMFLRAVTPFWRVIPRVSLPIKVVPAPNPTDSVASVTGLGDLNIFATVVVTPDDSPATLGIGPIYTAPTATDVILGNGKHEVGAAALTVYAKGILLLGALVNYQIGVGGDKSRPKTQFIVAQPIFIIQVGQGYYLRSAPIWFFDLEQPTYNVPFGLGAGKAIPTERVIYNLFIEPQFSIAVRGIGQPAIQIFAGMNIQFKASRKKKDRGALIDQLRARRYLQSEL